MTMYSQWLDKDISMQQRALIDRQMENWPTHFYALVDAMRAINCPGSILEVGCGVGHAREIFDRANVGYDSFLGTDINTESLAIAKERYPESSWMLSGDIFSSNRTFDTVIDGSCVLHVDDWKAHLKSLCHLSRRWVVLHRIPTDENETRESSTSGYGKVFDSWKFNIDDIRDEMTSNGMELFAEDNADGSSATMRFARPRHWATYCDSRYLGRLKALVVSMKRHCSPYKLHVLAWDEAVAQWCASNGVDFEITESFLGRHPELLNLPGPPRTRVEHYWTCGPTWIADVMKKTGAPVTYVDADVMFHSSPEPMFAEIGLASAGIIPHGFAGRSHGYPGPTLQTHRQFGLYNVGIVHFNDPAVANTWAADCRDWCYDRVESGKYGDQRYLDAWVGMYGAYVVEHPGACLGPWAIHTRALDVRNGRIFFGNRPLIAYHYSSLKELPDGSSVNALPDYQLTDRQGQIIYQPYWEALRGVK